MRADRLLKLAEFLETKVPKKHFDMSILTTNDDCNVLKQIAKTGKPRTDCETAGCAMGWLPVVFPRQWQYRNKSWPELRVHNDSGTCDAVNSFFEIDAPGANDLFSIRADNTTPKQVARNIRRFVKEHATA